MDPHGCPSLATKKTVCGGSISFGVNLFDLKPIGPGNNTIAEKGKFTRILNEVIGG